MPYRNEDTEFTLPADNMEFTLYGNRREDIKLHEPGYEWSQSPEPYNHISLLGGHAPWTFDVRRRHTESGKVEMTVVIHDVPNVDAFLKRDNAGRSVTTVQRTDVLPHARTVVEAVNQLQDQLMQLLTHEVWERIFVDGKQYLDPHRLERVEKL